MRHLRSSLLALLATLIFAAPASAQTLSGFVCGLASACLGTVAPIAGTNTYSFNYNTSVNYSGTIANPIVTGFYHELNVGGSGITVTGGDLLSGYFATNYNFTGIIANSNVVESRTSLTTAGTITDQHGFFENIQITGGGTIGEHAVITGGVTANNGSLPLYNTVRCAGAGGFVGNAPTLNYCVRNLNASAYIYTVGRVGVGINDLTAPGAMLDIGSVSGFNGVRILDNSQVGTIGWAFRPIDNGSNSDLAVVEYPTGVITRRDYDGGGLGLNKRTASGVAPGAGMLKMEVTAGTNAGSCKIIAYAGTSTTPVTIVDNVGSGC